jgi:uncharacterized protein (DUF433 family)
LNDLAVAEDGKALAPLKGVNPTEVLQRYLSDETTKTIAADYGVTRQALGQFLLKHAETEWKSAQVARALARKESAEDDLETAPDALSLARARERLRAAQWDLERVCRRIYGQDAPPVSAAAIQINIGVNRTGSAQVIDAQVIATDEQSVGEKAE